MMKKLFPYILAILILGLDQWSKLAVRHSMALGESIPVIDSVFHLTYIENEGVAFGLFSGHTSIFVVVSVLVLIGLLFFVWKESSQSPLLHYGAACVVAGALGNIIDRAMKASVTDMFDFRIWPIFNIADIAVCVGFVLLVLYLFLSSEDNSGKNTHSNS